MSEDKLWPRAANWLSAGTLANRTAVEAGEASIGDFAVDLGVVGVPAHLTSISATGAHTTPAAVREALKRYSTWSWEHGTDIGELKPYDFGDAKNPDTAQGEDHTCALVGFATDAARLTMVIGGDNSVTFAAMRGAAPDLSRAALITLDAHHDLRDGVSNGSPVRRLVEAGLPGTRVVQIGIADFSNSPEYAERARELGVTVIPRSVLRKESPAEVWAMAVEAVGDADLIYVDIDVDVCDRAEVPACPAAAPGGISADELREFAFLAGNTERVNCIDITEIDASADSADQRTIRLAALLILEAANGLANR
jgi:formiminoglutamase